MDSFTITNVAAARQGAASWGARSPWAKAAVAGANHALGRAVVLAAGTGGARRGGASWPATPMSVQTTQLPQFAALMAAELLPTTDIVNVTRKPKNVHKTRINAGGYGAMGPHPERERLA